jgi:hypothetical protein
MWRAPPDTTGLAYEFFAPFAHVPGRFEWCRVRSPTHGVFDLFIVLGASTSVPATVYHASDAGARFLAERYPECGRFAAHELRIAEEKDGWSLACRLRAEHGPVRAADMRFDAEPCVPRQVPYGGQGEPVWGSRFTCWGVDLAAEARVAGSVDGPHGRERVEGPGVLTLGSFGRIAPLAAPRKGS